LNHSFHNYLRISRILKALGEFGFERFKIHWIELFIEEIFVHGQLRNTLSSLQNFWVPTLRNRDDRVTMKNKIHSFLKQPDTDDEGDDMGSNEDMKDLPSPLTAEGFENRDASTAGSEDSSSEDPSEDEETSTKETMNVQVVQKSPKKTTRELGEEAKKETKKDDNSVEEAHETTPHLSAATTSSSPDVSIEAVATSSVAPASDVATPASTSPSKRSVPIPISTKSSFSEKSRSSKTPRETDNEMAASEDDDDRDKSSNKGAITASSADQTPSEVALSLSKIQIGSPNMAGSSSSECDSNLSASEDLTDKKVPSSSEAAPAPVSAETAPKKKHESKKAKEKKRSEQVL